MKDRNSLTPREQLHTDENRSYGPQTIATKHRFFLWITSYPWVVISLSIACMLGFGWGMQHLTFVGDYRVFFSKDNPQLVAYESMEQEYGKSDNVILIVVPQSKNVFNSSLIEAIRTLSNDAWQVPHTVRVDSITNFQHTFAIGDELTVGDLVSADTPLKSKQLDRIKQIALKDPQLRKKLISPSGHVAAINITIQLPGIDPSNEEPEVAKRARELAAEFELNNPNVEVHLSGLTMLNVAFVDTVKTDNSNLMPIVLLVVIGVIGIAFRTMVGMFSVFLVVLASIVVSMGLAGWSGIDLTGGSASAPIMILTLAVSDCVHILTTAFYLMRQGQNKQEAIFSSMELNLQPIFLASATTAVGFLSMNFSDSPPFRDLGNMVAVGVMLAFIFSITLFPALLTIFGLVQKNRASWADQVSEKLAQFVIGSRRLLLIGMTLAVVGLGMLASKNEINNDPIRFFDETHTFRLATDLMEENLSGMTTIDISIDSKVSGGITAPRFIDDLDRFVGWLRNQPETDHVSSISDVFKRLNKNIHGDASEWYRLPDSRELAAQYLLLYEMSLPQGMDLDNQINLDRSAVRVVGTFRNITAAELLELESRIQHWLAKNSPNYIVNVTGPNLMFSHAAVRNIEYMLIGSLVALLIISLLLGFALKSAGYALLSLVPNLAPALAGFGLWAVFDGEVNIAISVVVGMTLGIVVDDTVHLLSKYIHARKQMGQSAEQAIRFAFLSVGQALWITTLTFSLGFICLAQSSFKLNADMGMLTGIVILLALLIDFLLLPPLLMKLDNLLHRDTFLHS